MGENSRIEWTHHTFNPWWGCVKVSPGCAHCYAEAWSKRVGQSVWGSEAPRRFFGAEHWKEPRRWNAAAEKAGERRRVFCASMADVFEDRLDLVAERARLRELIDATPWLDWLLLTKRPQNIERLWDGVERRNVWMGTTAEDQERWMERVPVLMRVPAVVRFVSCEPLLGPIRNLGQCWPDWVICGGESGNGARAMEEWWAAGIRFHCDNRGIAFFMKQMGGVRKPFPKIPPALDVREFPNPRVLV